jgi:hypothetical protein
MRKLVDIRSRLAVCSLLAAAALMDGCEVRPKPVMHMVEYGSPHACVSKGEACPWRQLERQASFVANVNCLLAGAMALGVEGSGKKSGQVDLVTPERPKYGHEHVTSPGDGHRCSPQEAFCLVASRHDRELTWASCGIQSRKEHEITWRGGQDLAHADRLTESAVVTGRLPAASNEFGPPFGLNGPDHFYTFTLAKRTRVEAAVAANTSYWSAVAGRIQSAWQPALYLLSQDRNKIQEGYVLRAGVTALFPAELEPGTYYLVVEASQREFSRGDGIYRLYLGFNLNLMGPLVPAR